MTTDRTTRMTMAVADLIPDDIVIPEGWMVAGYPHGIRGLPGTIVPYDKGVIQQVIIGHYYGNSEHSVDILREV